jgi:predicted Zn-dependent protease
MSHPAPGGRGAGPRRLRRGLALLLVLAAACAPAPPPPEPPEKPPEIVLRTRADDRRAGEEHAKRVDAEVGLLRDPALEAYVTQIGRRLLRQAPPTEFAFQFQIADQDAPNAFALPGGFVYVSRGLLVLSNSEDELANVIGHEIIHVERRHAAARQDVMVGLPAILGYAAMAQAAAFSRDQEREADRLGQELAARSGYDPAALASFLISMEYGERLQLGFSRFQGWLDTHPTTTERSATASARARTLSWRREPDVSGDRDEHLRRLDGLVIGMGGSEGVVQRDRFLHPDLGFSMRFPDGWEVINTRQAVGALAPARDAQVFLELQGAGDDPLAASDEFLARAEGQGVRLDRRQPILIGDLAAVRAEGRAATPTAPVSVHLTWIAREGSIYRLTGVAQGRAPRYAGVFTNVARSFRPITARERASVRETRLRLIPARAGETIPELSRRTRNDWNIQETAVVNGVFADARFEAGQLVKVAVPQPYAGAAPPAR